MHEKGVVDISDDQLRASLEGAQLKLQRERGTDLTIFSPRASWMGHHLGNAITDGLIQEFYRKRFFDGYKPVHDWLDTNPPDVVILVYNDQGLKDANEST